MTKLERLQKTLLQHFPEIDTDIDEGRYGRAWLNIRLPKQFCVVGYYPRRGFSFDSIKKPNALAGFGQNFSSPDLDFAAVKAKLIALVSSKLKRPSRAKSGRQTVTA